MHTCVCAGALCPILLYARRGRQLLRAPLEGGECTALTRTRARAAADALSVRTGVVARLPMEVREGRAAPTRCPRGQPPLAKGPGTSATSRMPARPSWAPRCRTTVRSHRRVHAICPVTRVCTLRASAAVRAAGGRGVHGARPHPRARCSRRTQRAHRSRCAPPFGGVR
jgi:hypothetical protein